MSAWTWTVVKAKHIPNDILIKLCDYIIENRTSVWYYKEGIVDFDDTLSKWLKMHQDDYDYFVKDCGVPPEHMTKEYLTDELIKRIDDIKLYVDDIKLVKEGKLTLDECFRKYKAWKKLGTPSCYYIKNTVWVGLPYEIFRLREYSDMGVEDGLQTVDDLIDYLKNENKQSQLRWFENGNTREGMFPEFEQRLREYYGQFGDHNFSVHFG